MAIVLLGMCLVVAGGVARLLHRWFWDITVDVYILIDGEPWWYDAGCFVAYMAMLAAIFGGTFWAWFIWLREL